MQGPELMPELLHTPYASKPRRSCDQCTDTKVGCSKERPQCSGCARRGLRCTYSMRRRPGRSSQQHRTKALVTASTSTSRNTACPSPIRTDLTCNNNNEDRFPTMRDIPHLPGSERDVHTISLDFAMPASSSSTSPLGDLVLNDWSLDTFTNHPVNGLTTYLPTPPSSLSSSNGWAWPPDSDVGPQSSPSLNQEVPKSASLTPSSLYDELNGTNNAKSEISKHRVLKKTAMATTPPSTFSHCTCTSEALAILTQLHITEGSLTTAWTCSPHPLETVEKDLYTLDSLSNKLTAVLACDQRCTSRDTHLFVTVSVSLLKMIKCFNDATRPRASPSVRRTGEAEGEDDDNDDDDEPDRIALQLVLAKTHNVKRNVQLLTRVLHQLSDAPAPCRTSPSGRGGEQVDSAVSLPTARSLVADVQRAQKDLVSSTMERLRERLTFTE